ncbi:hypothetical protein [Luteimonas sp. 3794]|uniref:hypothetical protein n=1 Tax=Luteimonas sp. 3794 TaxID=2817730 RepID=UPI00285492C9|nr:hypothetical protein [Luteimonas sp. 3794]MDR6993327.1 apolipoprotein N-acyltransferase [Luteimonas sp. 3794]
MGEPVDPWHGDHRQRIVYAVHALILGMPVLWIGGGVALVGVYMSMLGAPAWIFMLSLMGLAGLIAWLRLSIGFLRSGRLGLLRISRGWWWGIGSGIAATLWMFGSAWYDGGPAFGGSDGTRVVGRSLLMLALGPALLPSVAHLTWLFWSARRPR